MPDIFYCPIRKSELRFLTFFQCLLEQIWIQIRYRKSTRQNISTRKLFFHTMVMMLISFLEFLENDKRVTQQLLKLHELQVLKLQVWYPSMPGRTTVRFLNFSPILRFVIFCVYTPKVIAFEKMIQNIKNNCCPSLYFGPLSYGESYKIIIVCLSAHPSVRHFSQEWLLVFFWFLAQW